MQEKPAVKVKFKEVFIVGDLTPGSTPELEN
jgi:hypothetical protein